MMRIHKLFVSDDENEDESLQKYVGMLNKLLAYYFRPLDCISFYKFLQQHSNQCHQVHNFWENFIKLCYEGVLCIFSTAIIIMVILVIIHSHVINGGIEAKKLVVVRFKKKNKMCIKINHAEGYKTYILIRGY